MSLSGSVLIFVAVLTLQTGSVRGIVPIACNVQTTNVQDQVHFYLHTIQNRNAPQEIFLDNPDSLLNSPFNAALDTKFTIHGWDEDESAPVNTELTNGYLNKGPYNIIVVDWGAIAHNPVYSIPRYKVDDVGHVVARFIEFIESVAGASLSKINLLGFSLGAHVAGFAAKYTGSRISAIVGMDPALPLFYDDIADKRCRLADTDTHYLLVIHTAVNTAGMANAIGHADFYVNYGYAVQGLLRQSHHASHKVMAASLRDGPGYWGKNCRNYFEVVTFLQCTGTGPPAKLGGDPINTSIRGIYELDVDILSLLF